MIPLWSRPLHLTSRVIAAAAGVVVVAERHTRLVALDARGGAHLWEHRVEDCWANIALAGDRCLYLSQAGVLHCVVLGTGEPLWSTSGLRRRFYVTVVGPSVFVGGWRGYHPMARFALADGGPLPLDDAAVAGLGPLARPSPQRDTLLVAGADRAALLRLDAAGAVLDEWALPAPADLAVGNVFLSGRRHAMGLRGDDCRKILHAALAYADGPDDAETMIDVPSGELAISSAACDGAGEKAMWLQPARPSSTPEHRGPPTPGADEGLTFKTQVTKYRVRVLWCTELGYAGIFARWLLEPAQR